MGDDDNSGAVVIHELLTQLCLNEIVRLQIHICSGLVKHKDLGAQQHRSCKANELFLSNREQTRALSHAGEHSTWHLINCLIELDLS